MTRATAYYLVFFIGGMPALMYQVVWQRVLTLYFGVDIYSASITVATFMLGLGLGSLAGGGLADRVRQPAWWYAGAELLLAVFGVFSLPLFSAVGDRLAGSGLATVLAVDFLLLLAPTTLMGMTLPLMCRVVIRQDSRIGEQLSRLYGANTLGAAIGALLTAYLLIGLLGLSATTYAAAGLNLAVALLILAITARAQRVEVVPVEAASTEPDTTPVLSYGLVVVLSFLSGFIALGYEIAWYRVLGVILKGTVYVFGTILFVYLTGIALGSLLARRRIDLPGSAQRFGICQIGISTVVMLVFLTLGELSWLPGLKHLLAASSFTTFHPAPELVTGPWTVFTIYSLADMLFWTFVVLFVPAFLMGYGFPNLMREGSRHVHRLGHSVGGLYFANIVGSTLGSLVVGFLGLRYLGTENTLRLITVLGGLVGIVSIAASGSLGRAAVRRRWIVAGCIVVLAAAVIFPGRGEVLRAAHFAEPRLGDIQYFGEEDETGVVALRRQTEMIAFPQEETILNFWRLYIDGATHGRFSGEGHESDPYVRVALTAHERPRRVLSIGLGDAKMCASALEDERVEELVIVELNRVSGRVLRQHPQGTFTLNSPRTRHIIDDGRRWLMANPDERFDVIMMFPLHAAHAFSGNLYSLEFMRLLRAHLNPGGIACIKTNDAFSTARTIAEAFPSVICLAHGDYVAGENPLRLRPGLAGLERAEVLEMVTADRDTILRFAGNARLNRDLRPNTEYYLTYPHTWQFTSTGRHTERYQIEDRARVEALVGP